MRLGVLYSGGKDSTLAAYLAKKEGYELCVLITIESENKNSYMFHTPNIKKVEKQAKSMNIPLVSIKTKGKKELELKELENAIKKAEKEYDIQGIVTGAVESVYQAVRVQKICNKLNLTCFNPLWQKDQFELLESLIKNNFEVIITSVAAYPLDNKFLGKKIDKYLLEEIKKLNKKYHISAAGEGGEFETFVLYCPLFKRRLKIKDKKIYGEENNYHMDLEIE